MSRCVCVVVVDDLRRGLWVWVSMGWGVGGVVVWWWVTWPPLDPTPRLSTQTCHDAHKTTQPTSRRPLSRGEVEAMARQLTTMPVTSSSQGERERAEMARELLAAFASSEERCVCCVCACLPHMYMYVYLRVCMDGVSWVGSGLRC